MGASEGGYGPQVGPGHSDLGYSPRPLSDSWIIHDTFCQDRNQIIKWLIIPI